MSKTEGNRRVKTGGRAKGTPNKTTKEIAAIAQQYGEQAIHGLWALSQAAESEAARVTAYKEILDRAYGKAKQTVDGNIKGSFTVELQRF